MAKDTIAILIGAIIKFIAPILAYAKGKADEQNANLKETNDSLANRPRTNDDVNNRLRAWRDKL